MNTFNGKAWSLLLATLLSLPACVTKSTHQTALDQLKKKHAKNRAVLEADRDARITALQAEKDKLAQQLEVASQRAEKLENDFEAQLQTTRAELEELRKQRAAVEQRLAEFKAITAKFQKMIDAGNIKVYIRRGRMIVGLPSRVLFPSGKAELSKRGLKTLSAVAAALKEFTKRHFLVAGHTDAVPIGAADFKDNWELSTARALTVTRFLIEQGLNPKNLAAAGYGEFDPVRSNKTRKGRRQNRRIELILEPNIAELPSVPDTQ